MIIPYIFKALSYIIFDWSIYHPISTIFQYKKWILCQS